MTESRHVYAASLGVNELKVDGGRIRLNTGATPYVEAEIRLSFPGAWTTLPDVLDEEDNIIEYGGPHFEPDPDLYDALDPLQSPPPRLSVTTQRFDADGDFLRPWGFHVRDRRLDHRTGIVTLALAGDEALLGDWAPLEDDRYPLMNFTSLRDVVDYVLDKVTPTASLSATPAIDADVTPYWAVTNTILNPRTQTTTNYSTGASSTNLTTGSTSPAIGSSYIRWDSVASGNTFLRAECDNGVSGGQVVTAWANMRTSTSGRDGRIMIRFLNGDGVKISDRYGAVTPLATGTGWTQVFHTTTAPKGSSRYEVYLVGVATAAAQTFAASGVMAYEDDILIPFFSGSTSLTGYTTTWEDAANASASTRTPTIERDPESLIWRADVSALDFLLPLVQAAGYRLVCDETRLWDLRDETFTAEGSLALRVPVNVLEAEEEVSRDAGLWFDARVTRYRWTDRNGIDRQKIDAYALNDPYTRVDRKVIDAPYPGPGRSEYAVRRAQDLGREITVTTVSDYKANAEQSVSVILPHTPTQIGTIRSVEFNLDTDEMTVTTRTRAVDPDSWLLQDPEETWLEGDDTDTWLEAG